MSLKKLYPRSSPRMAVGLSPSRSGDVHDVHEEEHIDVDIGPMPNNWSTGGLRATQTRQRRHVVTGEAKHRPGRRNEKERRRRGNEEVRKEARCRLAWADRVIVVEVS